MCPLLLVVGAGEHVGVHEDRSGDYPLGEEPLGRGFTCEVAGCHGVTRKDHRCDSCRFHLGNGVGSSLLDGCRVQLVGHRLSQLHAVVGQSLFELLVQGD